MEKLGKDLNGIDAIFLDLDGTIYMGNKMIDGAVDFLNRIEKKGIRRFFLSNNSSKSVRQYLSKLEAMGVPAKEEDILLSTHDLLAWLSKNNVSDTYLVGTMGMREMLEEAGVNTSSNNPQYRIARSIRPPAAARKSRSRPRAYNSFRKGRPRTKLR